jgi:pyruvate kinase
MNSKAQIVATIGPASAKPEILKAMVEHQMDVVRFNMSWGDFETRIAQIVMIREFEKQCGRDIMIVVDLPGPRIQKETGHTYNPLVDSSITTEDENFIKFAVEQHVDYIAVSFVGGPADIQKCRVLIQSFGGTQKIIAKIERKIAVDSLNQIIAVSDAVMVARGDLGNEVPLEQIPFVQEMIVTKSKAAGKPVIVATQMLISMMENPAPTRAEVTDVEQAIMEGADAVMLSEETAKGKYPLEAVTMMEKIVLETEKHMAGKLNINPLTRAR